MDKKSTENKNFYPPVVAVLGHVDHGKTTLLDAIRKTDIASREHGSITQSIGASKIELTHEGKKRFITFIDTPGHEAFSKMRGRGTQAADLALLIVSSTDGVMPQTKESIQLIKASKIPFIVVLTKSDLPDKNIEKVKQQLVKEEIMLEGYGGDVPVIEVSSKTGANIKELLDLILLVMEMSGVRKESSEGEFRAIVIESRLDQKSGPKATIVIKNGTLSVRDEIVAGDVKAKVRALVTGNGEQVKSATVGDAVEVLGFEKVPPVGALVFWGPVAPSSHPTASLSLQSLDGTPERTATPSENYSPNFSEVEHPVSIILAADTQGSLEALLNGLPPEINIVLAKTGDISTADILLAKPTNALVIGFNKKISNEVANLARTEKIIAKNYNLIYELIDELTDALEGKKLSFEEQILGVAQIQASFPFEKNTVLGIKITDGRVAKGDKARVVRGEIVIGEGTISSLRQGKEILSKVEEGQEAGVILSPQIDFNVGDMLISHG
ncbi:MAG: GTP-binding protein [Candidatus Levybacteria bacterium]|nr:GTP-binding protein [Candidatus Levybacteria bacterium]